MLDKNVYYTNLEYIIYNGSYMYTHNIKYVYKYTYITWRHITWHDITYIYIYTHTYIHTAYIKISSTVQKRWDIEPVKVVSPVCQMGYNPMN